jgi:hypothetical protein
MIFCEHCEYPITDRDKGCTNPSCSKNPLCSVESLGEYIVDTIIKDSLVRAECPDSPSSACVMVWAADIHKRLDKLISDYVRAQGQG